MFHVPITGYYEDVGNSRVSFSIIAGLSLNGMIAFISAVSHFPKAQLYVTGVGSSSLKGTPPHRF
jgi:hypothetical protein